MVRHNQRRPDRGNHRQDLLAHALAYADAGWPVFPLRPGSKRPAVPAHTADDCDRTDPRCNGIAGHLGWEQRATTDRSRIERAWDRRSWGIGIACGPAGLVVIDLDVREHGGTTGVDSLRQLEHDHGQDLPATFTVATPSGGRHLYYAAPPATVLANTAGTVGRHIDTRSAGGYVVAPPTRLDNSSSYSIVDDHPPVMLPEWFSHLLRPPKRPRRPARPPVVDASSDRVRHYVSAALAGELQRVQRHSARGNSNHTLFCASIAVGQLVGADLLALVEAETALEGAAHGQTTRADKPNTPTEIRQTIRSGLRRGMNEPRQLPTDLTERRSA